LNLRPPGPQPGAPGVFSVSYPLDLQGFLLLSFCQFRSICFPFCSPQCWNCAPDTRTLAIGGSVRLVAVALLVLEIVLSGCPVERPPGLPLTQAVRWAAGCCRFRAARAHAGDPLRVRWLGHGGRAGLADAQCAHPPPPAGRALLRDQRCEWSAANATCHRRLLEPAGFEVTRGVPPSSEPLEPVTPVSKMDTTIVAQGHRPAPAALRWRRSCPRRSSPARIFRRPPIRS
jgi:hypothetical protein